MTSIWKDFPEINRKLAFTTNISAGGVSLGCHCGTIGGVNANFGTTHAAAFNGINIQVLDTKKEEPIKNVLHKYTGRLQPPVEEYRKAIDYLKSIDMKFSSFGEDVYSSIEKTCNHVPIWVMSDVINWEAPARRPPQSAGNLAFQKEQGVESHLIYGNTAEFAEYLINKKIGYVFASPIVQNPYHRSKGNYSLNRVWVWIHPNHLNRAIPLIESHGEELFPSKENWIDTVRRDLSDGFSLEKEEVILSKVFNDGVFPIDKRFKQFEEAAKGA